MNGARPSATQPDQTDDDQKERSQPIQPQHQPADRQHPRGTERERLPRGQRRHAERQTRGGANAGAATPLAMTPLPATSEAIAPTIQAVIITRKRILKNIAS
jgi:hypothetical protein